MIWIEYNLFLCCISVTLPSPPEKNLPPPPSTQPARFRRGKFFDANIKIAPQTLLYTYCLLDIESSLGRSLLIS